MSVIKTIALSISLALPMTAAFVAISDNPGQAAANSKSSADASGNTKSASKTSGKAKSYSARKSGTRTASKSTAKKRTASKTAAAAPAKSCGTFMYRKGGKCMDARDKKST